MANNIVQLQDRSGNNIFPLAGGMVSDSITTQMLQDGAVTSGKIDVEVLPFSDIFTPASGFSIISASQVTRIGNVYFGYVGVSGTFSSSPSSSIRIGTLKRAIISPANVGVIGDALWNAPTGRTLVFYENQDVDVRTSTAGVVVRWFFWGHTN